MVYTDVDGTITRTPIPRLPDGQPMVPFQTYPVKLLKDYDRFRGGDRYWRAGSQVSVMCVPNGWLRLIAAGSCIDSAPEAGKDFDWV